MKSFAELTYYYLWDLYILYFLLIISFIASIQTFSIFHSDFFLN
ncbi:hypothetical protein LEP1GSC163_2897 [Leptospira santarosai str. CBC379]|nr:hypothetical protein LEP1GSC163_2897 [Leptospira santarosai str. CBC379]